VAFKTTGFKNPAKDFRISVPVWIGHFLSLWALIGWVG
jgi:hypothetical protein